MKRNVSRRLVVSLSEIAVYLLFFSLAPALAESECDTRCCCDVLNGTTYYEEGRAHRRFSVYSLTFGERWLLSSPGGTYQNLTGECVRCVFDTKCNNGVEFFWIAEGGDPGWSIFRKYLRIYSYHYESGPDIPRICAPNDYLNLLAIDSRKLRRLHPLTCADQKQDTRHCPYCIVISFYYDEYPEGCRYFVNIHKPEENLFCFSEMPMPESLVVFSDSDYLGDHDCGVYPPQTPYREKVREYIQPLISPGSGSGSAGNIMVSIDQDDSIQFLHGGAQYTRQVLVSTGDELLDLLPVTENTIVIVQSDDAFSDTDDLPSPMPDPDYYADSRHFFDPNDGWGDRLFAPERLNGTDSSPPNLGLRQSILHLSEQDIQNHLVSRRTRGEAEMIHFSKPGASSPSLMLIGQGNGVKWVIDTVAPLTGALFGVNGAVQIYNMDIEARLPENVSLFNVNHYLRLYRSSITLSSRGKIFSGYGVINASRSRLRETLEQPGETGHHEPMIRACRSDIHMHDWNATAEEVTAVNGERQYFDDFLEKAEFFLPQRSPGYWQPPINPSGKMSHAQWLQLIHQTMKAPNRYSQLSTLPAELRETMCPQVSPPREMALVPDTHPTIASSYWVSDDSTEGGQFVDPVFHEEAETDIPPAQNNNTTPAAPSTQTPTQISIVNSDLNPTDGVIDVFPISDTQAIVLSVTGGLALLSMTAAILAKIWLAVPADERR